MSEENEVWVSFDLDGSEIHPGNTFQLPLHQEAVVEEARHHVKIFLEEKTKKAVSRQLICGFLFYKLNQKFQKWVSIDPVTEFPKLRDGEQVKVNAILMNNVSSYFL